eukprot:2150734-Rhodomonas_salina.4
MPEMERLTARLVWPIRHGLDSCHFRHHPRGSAGDVRLPRPRPSWPVRLPWSAFALRLHAESALSRERAWRTCACVVLTTK